MVMALEVRLDMQYVKQFLYTASIYGNIRDLCSDFKHIVKVLVNTCQQRLDTLKRRAVQFVKRSFFHTREVSSHDTNPNGRFTLESQ